MKRPQHRIVGLLLWGAAAVLSAAEQTLEPQREPLRDPTRPPAAPVPAAPAAARAPMPVSERQVQLALQSVLVSDLRRRAMINDRLVGVGDRFAGMLVIDISSEGVVLQNAEETVTLSLPRTRVKHRRSRPAEPERGRGNGP